MDTAAILVTILAIGNFRILKKLLPSVGADIWKSKKGGVCRTRTFALAFACRTRTFFKDKYESLAREHF